MIAKQEKTLAYFCLQVVQRSRKKQSVTRDGQYIRRCVWAGTDRRRARKSWLRLEEVGSVGCVIYHHNHKPRRLNGDGRGGGVISGSSRLSVRVIDGDEKSRLSRRNYTKFDGRLVKGTDGEPRPRGRRDSCSGEEKTNRFHHPDLVP